MASHDAKAEAWTILIAHWPFLEKGDNADVLRKEWNLALDQLTDAQVAESLDYLRTRYGTGHDEDSKWPPQPSQFLSWSRHGGTNLASGLDPDRVRFVTRLVKGVPHEYLEPLDKPRTQRPELSTADAAKRTQQLHEMLAGELDGGLTPEEQIVLTLAPPEDQNKPAYIALRNKRRAALGWPLLDAQGRETQ